MPNFRDCLKLESAASRSLYWPFRCWGHSLLSSRVWVLGHIVQCVLLSFILIVRVCGFLFPEFCEPEFGAGTVTDVHGLAELALGGNTPEGEGVDTDGEELDADFYEGTDESPIQFKADKRVIDVILEKLPSLIVLTRPSPDILTLTRSSCPVENSCGNTPHYDCEDERPDRKRRHVNACLLRSSMTTAPVCEQHTHTEKQRHSSNTAKSDLRPGCRVRCPWWGIISRRKINRFVENVQSRRNQCKDYERTAEVDASQDDFCNSNTEFYFQVLPINFCNLIFCLDNCFLLLESCAHGCLGIKWCCAIPSHGHKSMWSLRLQPTGGWIERSWRRRSSRRERRPW